MADKLLRHLSVDGRVSALAFQSPLSARQKVAPQRGDGGAHGRRLLAQLEELTGTIEDLEQTRKQLGLPERRGMTIAVEFSPSGLIDYSKIEWKLNGIELLAVQVHKNSDVAVLLVPDGGLSGFVRRIKAYIESENPDARKNAALVNAIENIKRAAFSELWSDTADAPEDEQCHWFQLWLRHTTGSIPDLIKQFQQHTLTLGIRVEDGYVRFPGRVVVAAYGTRANLERTAELLDRVAEIRFVEPNAEFFLDDITPAEQAEWVNELLARTSYADEDAAPYVCILDTGVNNGHLLLANALSPDDTHTHKLEWKRHDHDGHGSEMAGVALFGDLTHALNVEHEIDLPHRLESVKILPPEGETAPHLWGAVAIESVARVEAGAPKRPRVFATMTTSVGHLFGAPSEWSATIDQLAFGRPPVDVTSKELGEQAPRVPRLFVQSAGNVHWNYWNEYPETNWNSPVQNPAQAWNALTVGAATSLVQIDRKKYPSYSVIAQKGHLSPSSTTSWVWAESSWPFKPDVVAEGGNGSLDAGIHPTVGPESLRVLTTSNTPAKNLLASTGDTSGAAAEVARICAHLRAQYPDYWPETIRALVAHGAEHTDAMTAPLPANRKRLDKEKLLRTFGFGLVSHDHSQFSTAHRPTMVIQRAFNPYRVNEKRNVVLGAMQLHDLPWPADELTKLGEIQVEVRITLSYFIEPNPSARGWQSKYRYQSFALKYAVKGASEDDAAFMQRINKLERAGADSEEFKDPDLKDWRYGPQLRARGSLHSDVWTGTAAQLASKSQIAVFPVGGWWKDWTELQQFNAKARYALVVSLKVSDGVDTDIYTPIANIIEQDVAIDIDVPSGQG